MPENGKVETLKKLRFSSNAVVGNEIIAPSLLDPGQADVKVVEDLQGVVRLCI